MINQEKVLLEEELGQLKELVDNKDLLTIDELNDALLKIKDIKNFLINKGN